MRAVTYLCAHVSSEYESRVRGEISLNNNITYIICVATCLSGGVPQEFGMRGRETLGDSIIITRRRRRLLWSSPRAQIELFRPSRLGLSRVPTSPPRRPSVISAFVTKFIPFGGYLRGEKNTVVDEHFPNNCLEIYVPLSRPV